MKILIIGDQHFRKILPYSSAFADERRGEWEEVKRTIREAANGCAVIVLMGDNLNSRHNHSSVLKEFIHFLNGFGCKEIHILRGNHETYGEGSALDFMAKSYFPKWHVHTEPAMVTIPGDITLGFAPYTKGKEMDPYVSEMAKKVDLFFTHNAVTPSKGGIPIDAEQEFLYPVEWLEENILLKTFFGHIHDEEKVSEKIQGVGSVFTQQVGEYERAVWVYDTLTFTTERIPLPVRGIYSVTWPDIFSVPQQAIVKVTVTDKSYPIHDIRDIVKQKFDAGVVIEKYDDERQKVYFEEGALDLSIEGLLKVYADENKINYQKLIEGYNLCKSYSA